MTTVLLSVTIPLLYFVIVGATWPKMGAFGTDKGDALFLAVVWPVTGAVLLGRTLVSPRSNLPKAKVVTK